ncbi:MAG: preprotein translocase subunit SecE [Candidatus Saccharimonadales bacterium]
MSDNVEPKKRRFKEPETFRERALKASEQKDASKHHAAKHSRPVKVLLEIARQVAKGYKKLNSIPQLKPAFTVLSKVGRILFPKYLRTSFEELRKVTWPSFKESRRLTYAVLAFAIIFGASVALVDWGLGKIFKHILLK